MHSFNISEAISFGWKTFKANAALLVGVFLISGVIEYAPKAIQDLEENGQLQLGIFGTILAIVFWLLIQLVELGTTKINIDLVDGKKASLNDLFSQTKVFFNGLIGSLVFGVIVVVGIIFLIVPGIWLAVRLQFFRYLIVDKKMDPFAALSESWKMTRGHVWQLVGFGVVLILVNLLGVLAFVVGVLVTAPLSMVAVAHVYRKLESK